MQGLLRTLLLLALLVSVVLLIATHGFVRVLGLLIALIIFTQAPKTRAWQIGERWLVRLTGSRRRAAFVVMMVFIICLAGINIWNITH